ncbi:MAG: hypothetical protein ACRDWI_20415 [Jiangellaceae bacterium]
MAPVLMDPDVFVASGPAGPARSSHGGRSWKRLELPGGAAPVEAVPGQPDLLDAGVRDGGRVQVRIGHGGGDSWF